MDAVKLAFLTTSHRRHVGIQKQILHCKLSMMYLQFTILCN